MSQANLEYFQQVVLGNQSLQELLAEITDSTLFRTVILRLAKEQGCDLAADELDKSFHNGKISRPWLETIIPSGRWMPIALGWKHGCPTVDWCYRGTAQFSESFFDQTISKCLSTPFNRVFRYQTPLDALAEYIVARPGVPLAGLIFHMSRCGSTLIAQMLAALPQAIVLAEAEPIDAVLRAHLQHPAITDDQRVLWLRWMVSALCQPQNGETCCVIKLDSWNTMELPLLQRAFPGVPCLFIYRDPLEVLASHQRQRGRQMVPGLLDPALFELDATSAGQMRLEEYGARVLAHICRVAVQYARSGACTLINYEQLPDVVWELLLELFQVPYTSDDIERLRHVSQFHAKYPGLHFVSDSAAKKHEASNLIRQLAQQWLVPLYKQLESLR